ncbi:uncharacterized protein LOC144684032 [Cetorhinus maximus]
MKPWMRGFSNEKSIITTEVNDQLEALEIVRNFDTVTLTISTRPEYYCEVSTTVSPTTRLKSTDITTNRATTSDPENPESLIYIVLGVLGGILVVLAVSLLLYRRQINKGTNSILSYRRDKTLHDNQELAAEEESTVYAKVNHTQRSSAATHREGTAELNNEEITYAAVQLQKKSSARRDEGTSHSVNNPDSVIYSGVMIHSQTTKKNTKTPLHDTPQESEMAIYATVTH